jgi:hypothetical protein
VEELETAAGRPWAVGLQGGDEEKKPSDKKFLRVRASIGILSHRPPSIAFSRHFRLSVGSIFSASDVDLLGHAETGT